MEKTAEQPNTTQSVSVSQNIEPTPITACDNIVLIPHSEEVEQVEGPCDKKSKSCDSEVSSSAAATEVIRAKYAQEEGYEYLQRGHSTEIFKIVISNIHPKMGFSVSNYPKLQVQ